MARVKMPRYSEARGWHGGDDRALYAFVGRATGAIIVAPIYCGRYVGPDCDVRLATRSEAEKHWQMPLHGGWKVA